MIEFISIKNFKILLDSDFPLSSLNVFSGLNGMGKSSLMQCLLLLRQSHEKNALMSKGLLLNGDYVELGTGRDILSESTEDEDIIFKIKWSEFDLTSEFSFKYEANKDLLPIKNAPSENLVDELSLFNCNFQYLSADRLSPQSHHQMSDFHIRDLNSLGHHGEYTVHFIAENGSKKLRILGLQHHKAKTTDLLANIEAWMSEITPGLKIKAVSRPEFNTASLSYAFQQGIEFTQEFKPQNVGFGLSYVLPVITSILSASKGDLLVIENPESHLHPAGQSAIGKLCALAAKNGVQLMIESHSDHFLNGVRVAVKEQLIDHTDVKLFFLHRELGSDIHASEVLYPNIDKDGRIDCWPDGFFDEWDNQLDRLL